MSQSQEIADSAKKATANKPNEQSTKDFIELALQRFKIAAEAEMLMRADMLDDLKFSVGEQWPPELITQRSNEGRPCLTNNRLPQFIRQITNEQRQQRPAIQINPIGDGADKETADIFEGCVRHIEVNSEADVARDVAFDSMVRIGIGWRRVCTNYLSDDGDEQEIFIEPIPNSFTVYDDPNCTMPDRSDAKFRFVVCDLTEQEYRLNYQKSEMASLLEATSVGDQPQEWYYSTETGQQMIRIAEYWYVEEEKVGQRIKSTVKCAIINALEILDQPKWVGKYIPIIPVIGDDHIVDGKRFVSGMVRAAKDPQRMYNYWVSSATETIALAPKAPFIIAEGQDENHEDEWSQANVKNFARLIYKPVSISGQVIGPPQRNTYEPPIQAMNQMIRQADNDLKSTTGIYDASLGEKGPDQSGKAILARQKQTDVATLNYSDNLARSIRLEGKILLDLIPKIYDAPRIQRIIHPDQTTKMVGVFNSKLSKTSTDDVQQLEEMQGVKKIYDLGVGRYDVAISVGPSYQSKRQEAVASIMALIQAYPQAMQVAGDLLLRNMDWPYSDEIADRLKAMLPPALQGDSDDPKSKLIALQSQLQAVMQQHEQLVAQLNQAKDVIQTKQVEAQNKMDVEKLHAETQITVAEINTKAQIALERMKWIQKSASDIMGQQHEQDMTDQQNLHEAAMSQMPPPVDPNAAAEQQPTA